MNCEIPLDIEVASASTSIRVKHTDSSMEEGQSFMHPSYYVYTGRTALSWANLPLPYGAPVAINPSRPNQHNRPYSLKVAIGDGNCF